MERYRGINSLQHHSYCSWLPPSRRSLYICTPPLIPPLLWSIHKWKDETKNRLSYHLQPIPGSLQMSKKKGSSSSALRRRMKKKKQHGTSGPVPNRTQGSFPGRDLIDPSTAGDPPLNATTTPARTTSKCSVITITQTPPNRLLKRDLLPALQDLDKERLNKPNTSTNKEAADRAKKQT